MIIVIAGVCGCGKTTIAQLLQEKFGWPIAEADDYHPESNKSKMAKGTPLTDEDRIPWLVSLHLTMQEWLKSKTNGIVTCSALKKSYRDILRYGDPTNPRPTTSNTQGAESDILFILLHGTEEMIASRMADRLGHFMPSSLLRSQLDTLEMPTADEHVLVASIDKSQDAIVAEITTYLSDKYSVQDIS